jgi:hypothetical protein
VTDYSQARLQRIEDNLRKLEERVSMLSAMEAPAIKEKIAETFQDPRNVIIYRGIERGLTQKEIAAALKERGLSGALQQRVSDTFEELVDAGFVRRAPRNTYVLRDKLAFDDLGLERALKKTLRKHKVDDLP